MASRGTSTVLNFERGGGHCLYDDVVRFTVWWRNVLCWSRRLVVDVDVGVFSRQNCLRQFVN